MNKEGDVRFEVRAGIFAPVAIYDGAKWVNISPTMTKRLTEIEADRKRMLDGLAFLHRSMKMKLENAESKSILEDYFKIIGNMLAERAS